MNSVKIVAVTQPMIVGVDGINLTPDQFIAYCARVSNPSNQMNVLTAPQLLKYCAKHKHWSVFEMVNIVMEIETTRDIARQILRHRSFSFQEFSQRYADPTKDLGFVTREARLQDHKNRQNSIEIDEDRMIDVCIGMNPNTFESIYEKRSLKDEWEKLQKGTARSADYAYKWAVENGIAKEQARALLPEGLTISRMYVNGTMRSWIHYCSLRSGPETQKEHREIATDAWCKITEYFPSLKNCLDIGEN